MLLGTRGYTKDDDYFTALRLNTRKKYTGLNERPGKLSASKNKMNDLRKIMRNLLKFECLQSLHCPHLRGMRPCMIKEAQGKGG